MAQDDMHVVMYKILAYLYACMKAGERADRNEMSAAALGINEVYWTEIIAELTHRRLIKGVTVTHSPKSDGVYLDNPRVTMEGVEFLMENSMMAKAKQFLMDFKASVPFV